MKTILPISAVVPTKDRSASLRLTLESLAKQSSHPVEIIVVDASEDNTTRILCTEGVPHLQAKLKWRHAGTTGAASQRNEGVKLATQPFVLFIDDDIVFEPACLERLWKALSADDHLGGVNAMIVNQSYSPPGSVSRGVFTLLHGTNESSFAGKVIGPAINLLPEDRNDLPESVPVEWLNLGCTLYRREALPDPPFDPFFSGYSMFEDLTLSLRVAKQWRLVNVRTARIFHDSRATAEKADLAKMTKMAIINRHYVMTRILGRSKVSDFMKLFLYETFQLAASAYNRPRALPAIVKGHFAALFTLIRRDRKA